MSHAPDILVLGLGGSGRGAARFAAALVARGQARSVTVVDSGDSEELRDAATQLEALGVTVVLGTDEIAGAYDLCIASPGIPPHAPILVAARGASGRVISEIEFAFEHSTAPWIAITGTNGKTTTTALTCHLLRAAGINAVAVGNIGPAATAAIENPDAEVFVAEVSSFQLALTDRFHPKVAVLLNITPDHLNWHKTLEYYVADKARIFQNLGGEDVAVVDIDDGGAAPFADQLAERNVSVVRVSLLRHIAGGATLTSGVLTLETPGGPVRLVPAEDLAIRGSHNVSNALAAAAAAHAMGASASDLQSGLRSFRPLAHRLEPVGTAGGVEWYDDSKATNPDAVFKALDAFGEQPLVVLLGGRNKGSALAPLAREVAAHARLAILFGEARAEFAAAFDGLPVRAVQAVGLADAIELAAMLSEPGDVVLLSPACASFDEFDSYEHRGDFFRERVLSVTEADIR